MFWKKKPNPLQEELDQLKEKITLLESENEALRSVNSSFHSLSSRHRLLFDSLTKDFQDIATKLEEWKKEFK